MRAKQNGRLIESLDPETERASVPRLAPARDWSSEVSVLKKTAAKLKGESSPVVKEAFAICRKSVKLLEAATKEADDLEGIRDRGLAVAQAINRLDTVLDRADWQI